jgi:pyrroline-5-carboxylate reductase
MSAKRRIVFIGAGNMAEALVKGLIARKVAKAGDVTVTDVRPERLEFFRREFGVIGEADNARGVQSADVCVLAVKPQVMNEALGSLRGHLKKDALVLSIMAGKRTASIEQNLSSGVRVVRVMPNTPALVGAGASAICAGRHATEDDLKTAEELFRAVGVVERVREEDMDAVTALSGSGPAYVFLVMEAMRDAARRMNLDDKVARELIEATLGGAALLAASSEEDPGALRERVTSKGGTTEAALDVLRSRGFAEALVAAIQAAHARSIELSKG